MVCPTVPGDERGSGMKVLVSSSNRISSKLDGQIFQRATVTENLRIESGPESRPLRPGVLGSIVYIYVYDQSKYVNILNGSDSRDELSFERAERAAPAVYTSLIA